MCLIRSISCAPGVHHDCVHHARQRLAWLPPGIMQCPPGARSMSERCFSLHGRTIDEEGNWNGVKSGVEQIANEEPIVPLYDTLGRVELVF